MVLGTEINESSFWCKQSPRLPKTSKFESKDRFDKHARIRDFKFLDKVLMKSNKTPVSLELEKFKWPFYISEIGRPLFLLPSGVHPSVTTRSSVGSFLLTRPIQFHPLRLIFQLIFLPLSLLSPELSCSGYVIAILSLFLRHLTLKVSVLFYSVLVSFKWYLWIRLVKENSVEILELRLLIKVPYLCLLHL